MDTPNNTEGTAMEFMTMLTATIEIMVGRVANLETAIAEAHAQGADMDHINGLVAERANIQRQIDRARNIEMLEAAGIEIDADMIKSMSQDHTPTDS